MAKDDFGFEPAHDEFGFEPDDKAALAKYVDSPAQSPLDALVGGAQQGATLSHADELEGALKAGLEKLSYGSDTKNQPSLSDLYSQYRDLARKKFSDQEQQQPGATLAGNLAGGFSLPIGEIAPIAKEASMGTKIAQGAGAGSAIGAISAEGAQEDPLLSDKTLPNMAKGAGAGAGIGAASVPVFEGATNAAGKAYNGAKWMGDVIGTPLGIGSFNGGLQQGLIGNDIASSKVPVTMGGEMGALAEDAPRQLINQLNQYGKLKSNHGKELQAAGAKVNPEDLEKFIQDQLDFTPKSNEAQAHGDAESLKEVLRTAKEGPEVEQVNRKFYGDNNTQEDKFLQQMKMKSAAEDMENPTSGIVEASPRDEFEKKANEKLAEQTALAGSQDPTPHEIHYEPIPNDPNHELAVVRQKQFDSNGQFQGYKSVMKDVLPKNAPEDLKPEIMFQDIGIPGKKMAIRRLPIKDDSGKISGYKVLNQKLISADDAAKFKDFTETVRAGNKDLTDPEQLLSLYKDLQNRSYGAKQSQFPEVQNQTHAARNGVQDLLRSLDTTTSESGAPMTPWAAPGETPRTFGQLDSRISALKDAANDIGLDTQGQDLSQGFNPELVNKKITDMIKKVGAGGIDSSNVDSQLTHFVNKVRLADPKMGAEFEDKIRALSDKYAASGEAQREVYSVHNLGALRSAAAKGGNVVGYGIYNATPTSIMNMAKNLATQGGKAQTEVAKVLTSLAGKPDQVRSSTLFGLMQNPAYRQILQSQSPDSDKDIQMEPVK